MAQNENNGVVEYASVSGMVIQSGENGNTEVLVRFDLGKAFAVESFDAMMPAVQARVESGKKPAGYLAKAINRIFLHRAHLQDALSILFDTYVKMSPIKESAKTAVWKARYAMLDAMPNAILKQYAKLYLPEEVNNFILTDKDDKVNLVTKLCTILADEKESEESEVTEVTEESVAV